MLCLDITSPRSILACSTHFTADDGKNRDKSRLRQARMVKETLAPAVSAKRTVFLGADLNTTPTDDVLDPLWAQPYGGGAHGQLVEVDSGPSQEHLPSQEHSGYYRDAGQFTFGRFPLMKKLDYIFVSGVTVMRAETGRSEFSDHRLLWAKVFQ